MRKQMKRACVTFAVAMFVSAGSSSAQTQSSGWPGQQTEAVADVKVVKSPVVSKPAAAAAPARPAAAPKEPAPKTVAPKPEAPKPATPKPATPKPDLPNGPNKAAAAAAVVDDANAAPEKPLAKAVVWPDAEPAARDEEKTPPPSEKTAAPRVDAVAEKVNVAVTDKTDASTPAAEEVIQLLQQQSDLLKRLAAEMESQRAVIKAQEDKIKSLELKASPASAPAAKAPATPPPPAITVETGGVKLKVSGLFQGWYTASDANVVDTFRLRRAELKFAGDISPRIKWTVMVDPAKALSLSTTTSSMNGQSVLTGTSVSQSGRIMQDAFVALNWKPSVSIEVGQQKVPLGYEGTVSSGKLDVVERALYMTDKARGAGYADIRDFGVMVRGKVAGGNVEYSGGVFNGLGEQFNDVDRNETKTMVGRVVAKPTFIKGLQVGVSMARDRFELFNDAARERQGAEMAYTRGRVGFRTEYFGGRDAAVTRQGGYVQMTARASKVLSLVARFDAWDPDTRSEATATTVTERDWLGGFTYILHPSGVWLQGNYIRKTFDGLAPSRNVFMTNVQTAW